MKKWAELVVGEIFFSVALFAQAQTPVNATLSPTPAPMAVQDHAPAPAPAPTPQSGQIYQNIPFTFGFRENGIELPPQEFEYSLSGNTLEFPNSKFDAEAQFFELNRDKSGDGYTLRFSWSKNFIPYGEISVNVIGKHHRTLFTSDITAANVSEFVEENGPSDAVFRSGQGHVEKKIPAEVLRNWPRGTRLNFCIKDLQDKEFLFNGICSKEFFLGFKENAFFLKEAQTKQREKFFLNGSPAPKSGSFPAREGKFDFTASFQNGASVEADILAQEPELAEIYRKENEDKLILRGHGPVPQSDTAIVTKSGWQVTLNLKDPFIYIPAKNGMLLKQRIVFHVPPLGENTRPLLKAHSRTSTYWNSFTLHGLLTGSLLASSTENEAHMTSPNEFDWNFKSDDIGKTNTRGINFIRQDKDQGKYTAYYSVYRGLPYEVSGHLSPQFTDAGKLLLEGQISASAWLEQIFKSESYLWSVQRWGASLDYMFPILNALNQDNHEVGYSTINFDLKYRLVPGIWNYDESYGPLLTYQDTRVNATAGAMFGIGAFWGKRMPKSVDDFMAKLSWLRYPKWIDAEFDYYFLPGYPRLALGNNFNILVHTKMFFKPDFFAQIGLSYKNTDFTNNDSNILVQTGVIYFTLGGGYAF